MRRSDPRPAVIGIVGGVVLAAIALLAAGAGHGTYLPVAIFGAPLSLVNVIAGLLGALLIWPAIGILAGLSSRGTRRWARWALLTHYAAAIAVASGITGSPLADWNAKDPLGLLPVGLLVYLLLQLGLWSCLRSPSQRDNAAA